MKRKDRKRITLPVQRHAGGGLEGDTDKPQTVLETEVLSPLYTYRIYNYRPGYNGILVSIAKILHLNIKKAGFFDQNPEKTITKPG